MYLFLLLYIYILHTVFLITLLRVVTRIMHFNFVSGFCIKKVLELYSCIHRPSCEPWSSHVSLSNEEVTETWISANNFACQTGQTFRGLRLMQYNTKSTNTFITDHVMSLLGAFYLPKLMWLHTRTVLHGQNPLYAHEVGMFLTPAIPISACGLAGTLILTWMIWSPML